MRLVHLGVSAMERLEHIQLPYSMEGGIRSVGKRRTRRGSLDSSHSAERAATRRRAEYAKLAGDTSSPPRVASDQGSTGSLSSDASSRVKASDDDVDATAFALQEYCASSPDAARVFVRKASPATVVRCLDWDAINAPKPKMREKYNNFDLLTFLEICRDEISAGGITGNGPNQFGYRNISMKLKAQLDKDLSKSKIKNWWDVTRRRYANWCHLQSAATGLGRDPETGNIIASDDWWKGVKKECKVFKKRPLPFPDLHEAVFAGRLVVGDHGDVAGEVEAEEIESQDGPCANPQPSKGVPSHHAMAGDPSNPPLGGTTWWSAWNTPYVDLETTVAAGTNDVPSPTQPGGSGSSRRRGKEKRSESGLCGSGGSSKRTKSDDRMIDIAARFVQYKEQAQQSASSKVDDEHGVLPVKTCMQLLKDDGYKPGDQEWTAAMHLFILGYWRKQFGLCENKEQRRKFLLSAYIPPTGPTSSMVQPQATHWGQPPGYPPGMVPHSLPPWCPPEGSGQGYQHAAGPAPTPSSQHPSQQWPPPMQPASQHWLPGGQQPSQQWLPRGQQPSQQWWLPGQQPGHQWGMPPWGAAPPGGQWSKYGPPAASASMWQPWQTEQPFKPQGQPSGTEGWGEQAGAHSSWSGSAGGCDGEEGS